MKILGVILLLLALTITILPQYNTCAHEGKFITLANGKTIEMKCSWTARAEIAVGSTLAVVGLMMILSRRKESGIFLAILGIVLGVFVILLPTEMIGVCTRMAASCKTLMKPALIGLGSGAIAVSVTALLLAVTGKEKEA